MRAFVFAILAAFLLFVPNAAAHTYLSETAPQEGAIVTESLQQITLTFEGKIEEGSTFSVTGTDGTVYKPVTIRLEDGVLTGTFDAPLPNDSYTVKWDSISQDGHPLSGEFSFAVDVPVTETPQATEQQTETSANEQAVETTEIVQADEDSLAIGPLGIVGAILLGIIFVSGIIVVMRNKNK